jgi:hypothetical protein
MAMEKTTERPVLGYKGNENCLPLTILKNLVEMDRPESLELPP